ncbi:MAG: DNA mismatch repair endonuclease MutL [Nitrospiraceae bacterium]|nr:MAG: DNA mismatch repair endonuclease MutL [Nitrospiraceae bacterium]
MPKIAVLPDILINKIAAGEVIERPASIVRELLDNSIDAGATRIDVEVLHGGKKLIKVSDNGSGMGRDDALLCFERHATSKIRSEDDLFDISTLGFRGEALPAIASVSKITLTSSVPHADTGVKIEIGVSQKKEISDAPPFQGTTVEVRDIFYNTPARRKFLKSNPTELSHIIETVIQKAFAYQEISFSLSHNGSELLNVSSASGLRERFTQLYGDELTREFFDAEKEGRGMKVYGFVSKADFMRAGKSHQYIFVNKRPVKNATVNHAVYKAYGELIPGGRHPAYFIFLDIDSTKVDVNVHPAKREVRFETPDEIHRVVEAAVYEALNPGTRRETNQLPEHHPGHKSTPHYSYSFSEPLRVGEQASEFFAASQADFFASGTAQEVRRFYHVGESFFATITRDGLLIIDQHAAHERILYEKFLAKTSIETEMLALPLRVELPVREYTLIVEHKDFLHSLGMDIGDFGGNNIIIRALPGELRKADAKGLLMDLAAGIIEQETNGVKADVDRESLLKNIAARLACHKSVRGDDPLTNEELTQMMSDLGQANEPDRCPHGRPTKILLTLDDLKKMFKRK